MYERDGGAGGLDATLRCCYGPRDGLAFVVECDGGGLGGVLQCVVGGARRSRGNGAGEAAFFDVVALQLRDGSGSASFTSRIGRDGLGVAHRCARGVGQCSRGSGAGGARRVAMVLV